LKILDRYLLKSFLTTFGTVFVILFLIFILQIVWLYISELAGKDLSFSLIAKFLLFKLPSIVPMVLPLSVLLASIMTYGSLSENYEFAAMKSSGISLQRAMKTLTYFILILSVVSFFFANNVIPYAEYKFQNFRREIAQMTPAMAIAEGQLSEVGNYNIEVEKKYGKDNRFLKNVTIHRKALNGEGNITVIKAKTGELESSLSSNVLKLILKDGYYYEDVLPAKYEERQKLPFAKATFKKDIIYIDLTKLNSAQNQGAVTTNNMLTIGQLRYTIDSLETNFKKDLLNNADNVYQRSGIRSMYKTNTVANFDLTEQIDALSKQIQTNVYQSAFSNIESTLFSIDGNKVEFDGKVKNINMHWISVHEKFMIAFSCILMFFIGAPLGAIIRKGGMGLPIVFAMIIFIFFHFTNTFGKKIAQEGGITPSIGVWLSTLILAPLAIYLTKTAINDIGGIITADQIGDFFKRIFRLQSYQESVPALVDIENYKYEKDSDWNKLSEMNDETLIKIVKFSNRYNYSYDYRAKAIMLLNERGITQQQLAENNQLLDTEFEQLKFHISDFKLHSKFALVFSILIIVLANAMRNQANTITIIGFALSILLYYTFLILTNNELKKIEKITTQRIIGIGFIFSLIFSGLYFIFFIINNRKVKQILTTYTQ